MKRGNCLMGSPIAARRARTGVRISMLEVMVPNSFEATTERKCSCFKRHDLAVAVEN
jgi:hypothetical protein